MPGYVFRLLPPRPSFTTDMSPEEQELMATHGQYWRARMAEGKVLAFGPVADPAGPYGLGVVVVDDLAAAEALRDADPAVTELGFSVEIAPAVRLVTPAGTYDA